MMMIIVIIITTTTTTVLLCNINMYQPLGRCMNMSSYMVVF